MAKLWDTLRMFNHKGRVSRPFHVLIENDVVVDEPTEVANTFGHYFNWLGGWVTPFEFTHRELFLTTMPDFNSNKDETHKRILPSQSFARLSTDLGQLQLGQQATLWLLQTHDWCPTEWDSLVFFYHLWTHVFPPSWKRSYIVPILKPGKDCNKVSSYTTYLMSIRTYGENDCCTIWLVSAQVQSSFQIPVCFP